MYCFACADNLDTVRHNTYFFASNFSFSGCSHVGLLFTNDKWREISRPVLHARCAAFVPEQRTQHRGPGCGLQFF